MCWLIWWTNLVTWDFFPRLVPRALQAYSRRTSLSCLFLFLLGHGSNSLRLCGITYYIWWDGKLEYQQRLQLQTINSQDGRYLEHMVQACGGMSSNEKPRTRTVTVGNNTSWINLQAFLEVTTMLHLLHDKQQRDLEALCIPIMLPLTVSVVLTSCSNWTRGVWVLNGVPSVSSKGSDRGVFRYRSYLDTFILRFVNK